MKRRLFATLLIWLAWVALAAASPPVELEIATERGMQITAPQEWLQLFTGIGVDHVEIRGIQPNDQPVVEKRGTPQRPSYHVVGILSAHNQLQLPGGRFSHTDRAKLKDYFDRLGADGAESLTAPRGRYGMTEKELKTVFADLTQAVDFETKGQPARAVIEGFQKKLGQKFVIDADAERLIGAAEPVADDVKGVSAGTALAMVLRGCGLVMRPVKPRGQAIDYRVSVADADAVGQNTLGKITEMEAKSWPIGWEPEKAPGESVPSLFESLNAEIDGYTLAEALAAIAPRLKMQMFLDHVALTAHNIDPAKIQIKLPRGRFTYKRLIDRVLSQSRLGESIRVDESGTSFLWVTR